MTIKRIWLLLATMPILCESLTFPTEPSNRRQLISAVANALEGAAIAVPVTTTILNNPQLAQAACLPGDLSPECIGVYKIPLQDALTSPTLNSPEALKRNAPDVNYVKPQGLPASVSQAKELLQAQRAAADDIQQVVLAGRLEVKVLNLIPKITGAGMTLQQQMQLQYPVADSGANQIRVMKYQQQLQELITAWSQIDVEIGQAIEDKWGFRRWHKLKF